MMKIKAMNNQEDVDPKTYSSSVSNISYAETNDHWLQQNVSEL